MVPYRRKRLVLDHIGLGQEAATLMKTLIVGFKIIQDEGCTLLFFSPDSFVSELFHARFRRDKLTVKMDLVF